MALSLKLTTTLTPPPSAAVAALEPLLLAALSSAPSLSHIKETHALLLRLHLHHNPFLITKLLRRLADLRLPLPLHPYPSLIFSQVPLPHRNSFLWTALIRLPGVHPPLHLYSLMRRQLPPPPPLSFTFSALLKSSPTLVAGAQIHAQTLQFGGFAADLPVQNTLIDMYVRFSNIDSARKVFDEMPVRDIISSTTLIVAYTKNSDMCSAEGMFHRSPVKDMVAWTAMVTGYAQNARPKDALDTFVRMQEEGVAIDDVSLVGAVSACAQLGALERARWVRDIAARSGFDKNVVVGSAMVDMYGKCGLIDEARQVFDGMIERNVYTYSAMISGLATHGRAREAIGLFKEMVAETDVRPNWVTFMGVLTACSHGGMVEEGRFYFSCMKDEYGIAPSVDHYTCMVDLLGRVGKVEEALELVRSMRVEPHGGVWGALLGACRIHGKIQIAEIAAEQLFKLEPDSVGNYVLLANTYSSAGMWDEVSKVRKLMRRRGLRKDPSSSWVETKDGVVHEFFAGDVVHLRSHEIKEVLDQLLVKLRLAGYAPNLSSVVYDVSDDEKERLLKGHSEKIALAFGLLTTEVGSRIRIVKNLRICEDCHLFMCFASSITSKEIVVRDNVRFHHFRNGECSCGGFW